MNKETFTSALLIASATLTSCVSSEAAKGNGLYSVSATKGQSVVITLQ
ncbi:MAG: hypothetical protein SNG02_01580 [Rikenellaceae bacterium]